MQEHQRESLCFTIGRAAHVLRVRINDVLKGAGLQVSPEEHSVLMVLIREGGPLRVGDLASRLMRDATTVKRQLDGLVDRAYVSRRQDEQDRRAVLMEATSLGVEAYGKAEPALEALRAEAFSGISEQDAAMTLQSLDKLRQNMLDSQKLDS